MIKFKEGDRVILVNIRTRSGGLYTNFDDGSNVIGNVGVVVEVCGYGWFQVLWDGISTANYYREHNLLHSQMGNV